MSEGKRRRFGRDRVRAALARECQLIGAENLGDEIEESAKISAAQHAVRGKTICSISGHPAGDVMIAARMIKTNGGTA